MESKIYYESRIKAYAVIFSATLFIIGIAYSVQDLSFTLSFIGIGAVAIFSTFFYKKATFVLTQDKFIWTKGSSKIKCPWSDVIAIHFDFEFNISNLQRGFKSRSFFIETKDGFTDYADISSLRRKGERYLFSQENEFIEQIRLKSNAVVKSGEVSVFKQTQKLKNLFFLLAVIFIVPVLIIFLFSIITGCNNFISLCY